MISSYTRQKSGAGWDIDPYTLALKIEAALPGKPFKISADGQALAVDFADDIGEEAVSLVDGIVATLVQSHDPLTLIKSARRNAVNERTEAIIRVGYEFPPDSVQFFSMSDIAQFNLEVANNARELPDFVYPVSFSFKDDTGSYPCPDADTLHEMWLAALTLKRGALDTGRALKNAISAAGTVEEIDSVVDDR
jgi:hypothetical protein